jgi:pimeloyl-ACP methyl ester carboxylesterase
MKYWSRLLLLILLGKIGLVAQSQSLTFTGNKTSWHGFDRYDFVMDEQTLVITPFTPDADEKNAVKAPAKGQRRCIVVVPAKAALGNPWSWQGCYWDHEPQTEVELLKRGFYVAFITPDPGKQWDAWYEFLTVKYGLAKKPAFVGMSKGGVNEYDWATANPNKVSCIYADNPAIRPETFAKLGELSRNDVPLLNVCGTADFLLEKNTLAIEKRYHELGGKITVLIKEGPAHHPHSIKNPKFIADWIVGNMKLTPESRPEFASDTFAKSYYYSLANSYHFLPEEKTYAVSRGPGFTASYERYELKINSQWGVTGMAVIVPNTIAPGKPWVFRSANINREAVVDQALLAKGYHIVIAPLTAQSGATKEEWDATYKFLIGFGFSNKPVMEGSGAAAGESFAWAIENPDKVTSIYAENPVMSSLMSKKPILENLASLATAHIPLFIISGSQDPWLADHTSVIEQRYKKLGGKIHVVIKENEGHFLTINDPAAIVDFIITSSK